MWRSWVRRRAQGAGWWAMGCDQAMAGPPAAATRVGPAARWGTAFEAAAVRLLPSAQFVGPALVHVGPGQRRRSPPPHVAPPGRPARHTGTLLTAPAPISPPPLLCAAFNDPFIDAEYAAYMFKYDTVVRGPPLAPAPCLLCCVARPCACTSVSWMPVFISFSPTAAAGGPWGSPAPPTARTRLHREGKGRLRVAAPSARPAPLPRPPPRSTAASRAPWSTPRTPS